MGEKPKLEKYIFEQEKIDPGKIKKIEIEKKIQSPINREKIEKIEKEKKGNKTNK